MYAWWYWAVYQSCSSNWSLAAPHHYGGRLCCANGSSLVNVLNFKFYFYLKRCVSRNWHLSKHGQKDCSKITVHTRVLRAPSKCAHWKYNHQGTKLIAFDVNSNNIYSGSMWSNNNLKCVFFTNNTNVHAVKPYVQQEKYSTSKG